MWGVDVCMEIFFFLNYNFRGAPLSCVNNIRTVGMFWDN